MMKNGKTIKCKTCKKPFYVSGSRIGFKKYCSRACGFKDNFGFKPKQRKCKICGKVFTIKNVLRLGDKTCSSDCWKANNVAISKARSNEKSDKICKVCGITFTTLKYKSFGKLCNKCRYNKMSTYRTGEKNSNYKDGHATKEKFGGKRSVYTAKHMYACKKYRKAFKDKHGFLFCEDCGVNENGTSHFEVHHIRFASRYPHHLELHNPRNLILLCKQCHVNHHGPRSKELLVKRESERNLKELFKI